LDFIFFPSGGNCFCEAQKEDWLASPPIAISRAQYSAPKKGMLDAFFCVHPIQWKNGRVKMVDDYIGGIMMNG
jgi:hypothetical protein